MITELQARSMSNEQVLEVLRKSCEKRSEKLIHAQYNPVTLELTVLVEMFGGRSTQMTFGYSQVKKLFN